MQQSSSQAWSQKRTLTRGIVLAALSAALVFFFSLTDSASTQEGDDKQPYVPELFPTLEQSLKRFYLDPTRIQPRKLVRKALGALENAVDEIYVKEAGDDSPLVQIHLSGKVYVVSLAGVNTLQDVVSLFDGLFNFVRQNYRGNLGVGDIQYAVANGFLSGLDPHTMVFSPKDFRNFSVHIEGEIFGVGMYVGNRDGKLTVIEVLPETPAQRAGFKKNDQIAQIGDESTINMTVPEAVDKIRGPRKSKVTLTVKRARRDDPNKLETIPIEVARDKVVIKSVESKLINDRTGDTLGGPDSAVGYVTVRNFDKNTTDGKNGLIEHLAKLEQQNGGKELAGLILDLRGNSGGLLRQAVKMSDLFLTRGDIVVQATRGNLVNREDANDDDDEPTYPIVVLSDQGSASGAEIVIGALQKNDRAVVLGTRTFGKGSVQQLHRMPREAQLKITVSEYLIPGDISIQSNGVVPDILALPVTLDGKDNDKNFDLFPRVRSLTESNYQEHIVSRYAKEEEPSFTLKYLHDPVEYDADNDPFVSGNLQPAKDKLVLMALGLLGDMQETNSREAVLKRQKDEIEELNQTLYAEIVARLAELGIDWSAGENPTEKNVQLTISSERIQEPSGDDEDPVPVNKLRLTARLTNNGTAPLYRVKGITSSEYFLYKHREFLFGKVAPGETVERSLQIRLPYFPNARNDLITIELSGEDDAVFHSGSLALELLDGGRPRFAFKYELIDAKSERPIRSLEPETQAVLRVTVTNSGDATAHKGVVILRSEMGREVFLSKGRVEFTELEAGGDFVADCRFNIRAGVDISLYKFELAVVDSYSGANLSRKLEIPSSEFQVKEFTTGTTYEAPIVNATFSAASTNGGGEPGGPPLLVTGASSLTLKAMIESASGAPFKSWVIQSPIDETEIFPDKIFFVDSKGRGESQWQTVVPLSEGTNVFTVVAEDNDGLMGRKNLVVRRVAKEKAE